MFRLVGLSTVLSIRFILELLKTPTKCYVSVSPEYQNRYLDSERGHNNACKHANEMQFIASLWNSFTHPT